MSTKIKNLENRRKKNQNKSKKAKEINQQTKSFAKRFRNHALIQKLQIRTN